MIGKRRASLVLAASAAAFMGGCAVSITSEPSGARVLIDGAYRGTTPLKIDLQANFSEVNDTKITLEHPGYHSMTTRIRYRRLYELTYPLVYALLFRVPVESQHFVMAPLPPGGGEEGSPVPAATAPSTEMRLPLAGGPDR